MKRPQIAAELRRQVLLEAWAPVRLASLQLPWLLDRILYDRITSFPVPAPQQLDALQH